MSVVLPCSRCARWWRSTHPHPHCASDIEAWYWRHNKPQGEPGPLRQVAGLARVWYGQHARRDWRKWTISTRKRSFPTPDLHRRFGIHNDFWDSSGFLQNKNMAFRSAVLFSLLASSLRRGADPTAAIRAAIQQYVDVRKHPDAEALERLFTADADQLVSSGEWRKGREAVVKGTIAASSLARSRQADDRYRVDTLFV